MNGEDNMNMIKERTKKGNKSGKRKIIAGTAIVLAVVAGVPIASNIYKKSQLQEISQVAENRGDTIRQLGKDISSLDKDLKTKDQDIKQIATEKQQLEGKVQNYTKQLEAEKQEKQRLAKEMQGLEKKYPIAKYMQEDKNYQVKRGITYEGADYLSFNSEKGSTSFADKISFLETLESILQKNDLVFGNGLDKKYAIDMLQGNTKFAVCNLNERHLNESTLPTYSEEDFEYLSEFLKRKEAKKEDSDVAVKEFYLVRVRDNKTGNLEQSFILGYDTKNYQKKEYKHLLEYLSID